MKSARPSAQIELVRQHILDKALDIIVSEGLSALTMRRLARDTGMTAPNLYNYFSNKDQIHTTLVRSGFEALTNNVKKATEQEQCVRTKLRRFMDCYIEFGIQNQSFYEIMFSNNSRVGGAHGVSGRQHSVEASLATENRTEQTVEGYHRQLSGLAIQLIEEYGQVIGASLTTDKSKEILAGIWSTLHGLISLHQSRSIYHLLDSIDEAYDSIIGKISQQIECFY